MHGLSNESADFEKELLLRQVTNLNDILKAINFSVMDHCTIRLVSTPQSALLMEMISRKLRLDSNFACSDQHGHSMV